MGFHGHLGEAMARTFQQGGHMAALGDYIGPKREFLRGIEEQATVESAFFPCGTSKAVEIEDIWRGPGKLSLGLTGSMEGGSNGTGGTFAGGNQQTAIA